MKNSRKILFTAFFSLPLASASFATDGFGQEEGDASPAPMDEQSPLEEAPIDSSPLPGEASEDIPTEIQQEADESGPAVDDSYNTTNTYDSSLFSDIYVGPTVQIGFPQILGYGVEALFARTVSAGFSVNSYTIDQIDKAEVEIKGWDAHLRWHPWMGSFFVGGSYGRMEVDGDYQDKFIARTLGFEREVEARINATIKTNYFTPRLGWFAVWESGLTFGFDIGAQIPLGPKTSVNTTFPDSSEIEQVVIKQTEEYKDLEDQADEAIKLFGKRTIPVVTLLSVGWLF